LLLAGQGIADVLKKRGIFSPEANFPTSSKMNKGIASDDASSG